MDLFFYYLGIGSSLSSFITKELDPFYYLRIGPLSSCTLELDPLFHNLGIESRLSLPWDWIPSFITLGLDPFFHNLEIRSLLLLPWDWIPSRGRKRDTFYRCCSNIRRSLIQTAHLNTYVFLRYFFALSRSALRIWLVFVESYFLFVKFNMLRFDKGCSEIKEFSVLVWSLKLNAS